MATDEDISLMGIDNLEFIEAAKCFPSIWVRLSARTKKPKLTIDTFDPGKLNVLGMYNRETGVISYSNKLTSKKLKSHFTPNWLIEWKRFYPVSWKIHLD